MPINLQPETARPHTSPAAWHWASRRPTMPAACQLPRSGCSASPGSGAGQVIVRLSPTAPPPMITIFRIRPAIAALNRSQTSRGASRKDGQASLGILIYQNSNPKGPPDEPAPQRGRISTFPGDEVFMAVARCGRLPPRPQRRASQSAASQHLKNRDDLRSAVDRQPGHRTDLCGETLPPRLSPVEPDRRLKRDMQHLGAHPARAGWGCPHPSPPR